MIVPVKIERPKARNTEPVACSTLACPHPASWYVRLVVLVPMCDRCIHTAKHLGTLTEADIVRPVHG